MCKLSDINGAAADECLICHHFKHPHELHQSQSRTAKYDAVQRILIFGCLRSQTAFIYNTDINGMLRPYYVRKMYSSFPRYKEGAGAEL